MEQENNIAAATVQRTSTATIPGYDQQRQAGGSGQRAGERFETSAEQSTNFVVGMATCLRKGKGWVGVGKIQLGRSARRAGPERASRAGRPAGNFDHARSTDHFRARTDPQIIFEHLASGMVLTMNEH